MTAAERQTLTPKYKARYDEVAAALPGGRVT